MNVPLQITFRDIEPNTSIEETIRRKAEKLEQFFDRITSCRVMVEAPHRRHNKGNLYHIRIDLTVPGEEIVVTRHVEDEAHRDVYVTIRDAFEAARRELKKIAGKRHDKAVAPTPMPPAEEFEPIA